MDRNSVVGLILIAAVIMVFGILNKPSKEELEQRQKFQDSIEASQLPATSDSLMPAAIADSTPITGDSIAALVSDSTPVNDTFAFSPARTGNREEFSLENDLIRVSLSSLGGKISSVELKKYKTYDGKPLMLIKSDTGSFGFNFFSQNRSVSTSQLYFSREYVSADSVVLKLDAGENRSITYHYSIKPDSYLFDFEVQFHSLNKLVAPNTSYLELGWNYYMLQTEKDMKSERMNAAPYYMFSADKEVESMSFSKDEKTNISTRLKWVAFKQHFFTCAIIAAGEFEKPTSISISESGEGEVIKSCAVDFSVPFNHHSEEATTYQFYFGPNHYQTLKKLNLNMEQLISLGFFGFVSKWLVIPVFNWLNSFNLNFGIIILILTILIRIILLPLTYKSFMATAKMRVLQPEVSELNEKYKEDAVKKQQALMALYRKAGVNPLGGCIPALLQVPILFAMFSFFPTSIELRQESFLWAKDLSTYDSILNLPFTIPFYGNHVSLFTLLMTVSFCFILLSICR